MRFPGKSDITTRDTIIDILLSDQPLTAKQIFNSLKKNGQSITYQAVHRLLQRMEGNELIKTKGYELNPEWITDLQRFAAKYQNKKFSINHADFEAGFQFNFKKISEIYSPLLDIFERAVKDGQTDVFGIWKFIWDPIVFSVRDSKRFIRICKQLNGKFIVSMNTEMDRYWYKNIWKEFDFQVKLGVDYNHHCDIICFDENILEVHFCEKFLKEFLYGFRSKTKPSIWSLPKQYLFETRSGYNINIVGFKNKHLAKEYTKIVEKYFK